MKRNDPKNQNKNPKRDDNFQWSRATKTLLFWLAIFILIIWITTQFNRNNQQAELINYNEFNEYLVNNKIQSLEITEMEVEGVLVSPETRKGQTVTRIRTLLPDRLSISEANELFRPHVNEIEFKEKSVDVWGYMLQLLPWILLAGIWLFFLRRMQGGGGGARGIFNFGRSRARLLTENRPRRPR